MKRKFGLNSIIKIFTPVVLMAVIIGAFPIRTYSEISPNTDFEDNAPNRADTLTQDNGIETLSGNLYTDSWLTPVGEDELFPVQADIEWLTPEELETRYPIPGSDQDIDETTETWIDNDAHWKGKLLKVKDGKKLYGNDRIYTGVCMVKVNRFFYLPSCRVGLTVDQYENGMVGDTGYTYKQVDEEMVFWARFANIYDKSRYLSDVTERGRCLTEYTLYKEALLRVWHTSDIVPRHNDDTWGDVIGPDSNIFPSCDNFASFLQRIGKSDLIDYKTDTAPASSYSESEEYDGLPMSKYKDQLIYWMDYLEGKKANADILGVPEDLYMVQVIKRMIQSNYEYKTVRQGGEGSINGFLEGVPVRCVGIAHTFSVFCLTCDIYTMRLDGFSPDYTSTGKLENAHEWNLVYLGGNWYRIEISNSSLKNRNHYYDTLSDS